MIVRVTKTVLGYLIPMYQSSIQYESQNYIHAGMLRIGTAATSPPPRSLKPSVTPRCLSRQPSAKHQLRRKAPFPTDRWTHFYRRNPLDQFSRLWIGRLSIPRPSEAHTQGAHSLGSSAGRAIAQSLGPGVVRHRSLLICARLSLTARTERERPMVC